MRYGLSLCAATRDLNFFLGGHDLHRVEATELRPRLDIEDLRLRELAEGALRREAELARPRRVGLILHRQVVAAIPAPVLLQRVRQIVDVVLAGPAHGLEDEVAILAPDVHAHDVVHRLPGLGINDDDLLARGVMVAPAPLDVGPHGVAGLLHLQARAVFAQGFVPGHGGHGIGDSFGAHGYVGSQQEDEGGIISRTAVIRVTSATHGLCSRGLQAAGVVTRWPSFGLRFSLSS